MCRLRKLVVLMLPVNKPGLTYFHGITQGLFKVHSLVMTSRSWPTLKNQALKALGLERHKDGIPNHISPEPKSEDPSF